MSRILVDQIRSNSASADAITLDGSGNLTIPGNITCNGNASVSGTATGFGGGKLLQVVTATTSTEHTNSSTTFADTGLTANITPSATSSKILILISQSFSLAATGTDVGGSIRLLRDSTTIDTGVSGSSPNKFYNFLAGITSSQFLTHYSLNLLDSPNTTSSVTYKTQDAHFYGGHTIKTQASSYPSYITLLEVGA